MKIYFLIMLVGTIAFIAHMPKSLTLSLPMSLKRLGTPKAS